jgi:hypothetical protein
VKTIRRLHAWLGVLFAPSIILFALSGMCQLYGCHEGEGDDQPAGWVVRIAQLHMHQTVQVPGQRKKRPEPPAASPTTSSDAPPAAPAPAEARPPRPTTGPLKAFFCAMSIALMLSSIAGLYIAFTSKRDRGLHIGLLAAGIVLPILLMLL